MGRKKEKKMPAFEDLSEERSRRISGFAERWLIAIALWGLGFLILLSLFGQAGPLGQYIALGIAMIFGWGKFAISPVLFFTGYFLVRYKNLENPHYRIIGLILSYAISLGMFALVKGDIAGKANVASMKEAGGFVGLFIGYLASYLGFWGGMVVLITLFLVGIVLILDSYVEGWKKENAEEDKNLDGTADSEEEDEGPIVHDLTAVAENKNEVPIVKKGWGMSLSQALKGIKKVKEKIKTKRLEKELDRNGKKDLETAKFEAEKAVRKDSEAHRESGGETKAAKASDPGVATGTPFSQEEKWQMPPINLLQKNSTKAVAEDIKKNSKAIQKTLANFGIPADVAEVNVGPTVTQYSLRPAEGIKLSRITAIQSNIAMSLAAHPIRIEAPIPGKSLVGVEVPNKQKRTVSLRELIDNPSFIESDEKLLVAFGEDSAGNYVYSDLAEMPHLLVAGTTGSGKSIGINCIIASLLFRNTPRDLKLIMVDPKRVELTLYNSIPHLLTPVIVDYHKVINALKWAVGEMERRYSLIQETMSRNIVSYNKKVMEGEVEPEVNKETGEIIEPEYLPYIVIVIDELADLMSSNYAKEVEGAIVRLAQMSRAIGIHLILSTQRPSVNVITGIIKANFPTRIAFQVFSQIDSRTILDMSGAEKLLGKGDMLFLPKESSQPRRIQGAFVSEEEVRKLVEHLSAQEPVNYNPMLTQSLNAAGGGSSGASDFSDDDEDNLYEEAKQIVTREKKASTSLLQRHLRIGYSRAARIIDLLEGNGVISPAEGNRPRQVLMSAERDEVHYEHPAEDQAKRDNWER